MDDWAGVEDPDWKANHQLSWEQLTDVREIGKVLRVIRGMHVWVKRVTSYRKLKIVVGATWKVPTVDIWAIFRKGRQCCQTNQTGGSNRFFCLGGNRFD